MGPADNRYKESLLQGQLEAQKSSLLGEDHQGRLVVEGVTTYVGFGEFTIET